MAPSASRPSPRRWLTFASLVVDGALLIFVVAFLASTVVALFDDSISTGAGGISVSKGLLQADIDPGRSYGSGITEDAKAYRADYGPTATQLQPVTPITVSAKHPRTVTMIAARLGAFVSNLIALWLLYLLRSVLARAADGKPFDPRNVAALRWMALGLVLFAVWGWGFAMIVGPLIVADAGGHGPVFAHWEVAPFLVAVLLLALAEVWQYGIALQRDVEATV
jgi:hypothetical protein